MSHNGWTNYATWRVNLEIFDGIDPRDMGWNRFEAYELGQALKDYAQDVLESTAKEGLALDYARAFILDVNWREIAAFMLEAYAEEEA